MIDPTVKVLVTPRSTPFSVRAAKLLKGFKAPLYKIASLEITDLRLVELIASFNKPIIISTGAQARWLNLKSEQEFRGFGVSACATCDGFFFKNKEVAVVGGGNAAVEEAMFLTKFASKVKLIHRRDSLRAEKMLQKKLMENKKIEIIWDTVIEDVLGEKEPKNVKGIKVKNVKTNKIEEIKVDGLFVAIGHDPATSLFKDQLKMDNEGYLITKPDSTETNVPGVYAAGDVKDKTFRQAVTAAGMGCMAALEAEKHLSQK